MKITPRPGRIDFARSTSSVPSIPGMITSVSSRSIGCSGWPQISSASPPPPVPITAFSRDHSREVYEEVVIPMFKKMQPAPRVSLTQFGYGTHGYMEGEYVEGVDTGIGPAVFLQWDQAIKGGYFLNQ